MARRVAKAAAMVASVVSVFFMVVLFTPLPVPRVWASFAESIGLLPLLVSTPIAAALLAVLQRGWVRVLSLCALLPASAAAIFALTVWLLPPAELEVLGLIGFVLVELVLPATALLVGAAALTLTIQDVGVWLKSRRVPEARADDHR